MAGFSLVAAGGLLSRPGIPDQGILTVAIRLLLLDFPGSADLGAEGRQSAEKYEQLSTEFDTDSVNNRCSFPRRTRQTKLDPRAAIRGGHTVVGSSHPNPSDSWKSLCRSG